MTKSVSPLSPLNDGPLELRGEYRRRNALWDLMSVKSGDVAIHEKDGWIVHKHLKSRVKMQKARTVQVRLQNKWWILLFKMGYAEMNIGDDFRVLAKKKGGMGEEYPLAIFAKDEETVIVAQCRALSAIGNLKLSADLQTFSDEKSGISSAIKTYYGTDFKPKILWFFVTENVVWSDDDQKLAEKNNIRRVTELEMPYFTQLAEHLGHAARYQFLAEFLKDQKIPELEGIKVPATRGRLGGETFYSFVATPRQLLRIAFVNHRTLADPEGFPTYQRLIQKGRLKEIGRFIEGGGYFPNSLLINFPRSPRFDILQKDVAADVHHGMLYLPSTYKSAWVIDGQHRLYGYANVHKKFLDAKIIIVAFDGLRKVEEANLFVTINHEQKSVPKTLLDDLEGQLMWGSEDPSERIGALAARVIQQSAREIGGPLYNRMVAEGMKATEKACLTVPQVKLGLKRSGLLGRVVDKHYQPGPLSGGTDNATLVRAHKVINGYFMQIMNADMVRWDSGRTGHVCNNEGIQAFTVLLGEIISHLSKANGVDYRKIGEQELLAQVRSYLDPVLDFIATGGSRVDSVLTVPFGSGGPREYLFRLTRLVRTAITGFSPDDYADWEVAQSEENRTTADQQIQEICNVVQRHIFAIFRKMYGEEKAAYWEKGVPNGEMRTTAYGRSTDDDVDERGPLESYLNFVDFKKIIEKSDRWPLFKEVFDISLDGTKGQGKNISWMDRINELRRIAAHPGDGRRYKADDFPLIDRVHRILLERIGHFDYDSINKL